MAKADAQVDAAWVARALAIHVLDSTSGGNHYV